MTVQELINKFNEVEDKTLELDIVSPYHQTRVLPVDGICIAKLGNRICFDIETHGLDNIL